jgi:hypothetical protein
MGPPDYLGDPAGSLSKGPVRRTLTRFGRAYVSVSCAFARTSPEARATCSNR